LDERVHFVLLSYGRVYFDVLLSDGRVHFDMIPRDGRELSLSREATPLIRSPLKE
jgi:hypothetical protein